MKYCCKSVSMREKTCQNPVEPWPIYRKYIKKDENLSLRSMQPQCVARNCIAMIKQRKDIDKTSVFFFCMKLPNRLSFLK